MKNNSQRKQVQAIQKYRKENRKNWRGSWKRILAEGQRTNHCMRRKAPRFLRFLLSFSPSSTREGNRAKSKCPFFPRANCHRFNYCCKSISPFNYTGRLWTKWLNLCRKRRGKIRWNKRTFRVPSPIQCGFALLGIKMKRQNSLAWQRTYKALITNYSF